MRGLARLLVVLACCTLTLAAGASARAEEGVAANSGLPGSTCQGTDGALPYSEPDGSVSTDALGPEAPSYYEVGMPTGAFAGRAPKAVMLMVPGGGWFTVGKGVVQTFRSSAEEWRSRGWMTVNLSYRACDKSLVDVLWFMKRVRQLEPTTPICASGGSAGGHLVLMLASIRSDLACALAMGAPTDFATLARQRSWNPSAYTYDTVGPTKLLNWASAAFAASGTPIGFSSPLRYAGHVHARVMVVSGEHDVFVPPAQTHGYAAALRSAGPANYVDELVLEPGKYPFVHTGVSKAARDLFDARVDALVAPVIAGR
jgi:acetyl esterase/lipase